MTFQRKVIRVIKALPPGTSTKEEPVAGLISSKGFSNPYGTQSMTCGLEYYINKDSRGTEGLVVSHPIFLVRVATKAKSNAVVTAISVDPSYILNLIYLKSSRNRRRCYAYLSRTFGCSSEKKNIYTNKKYLCPD